MPWTAVDRFEILGTVVEVRSNAAEVIECTRFWLRSFPRCGHVSRKASLILAFEVLPSQPPDTPILVINGQSVGAFTDGWQAVPLLQMEIGAFLPRAVADYVLLHAGAVACRGGGILLPAASRGGKSTLTLALFLHEMDYYSDEVAVISTASGHLIPFPKPIASRNPDLHPALAGRPQLWHGPARQPGGPVWYAQAEDIRTGAIGQAVPIRYLIFPQHAPGQRARLDPLPASAAMRALLANSVNFAALGGRALEALGRLARTAQAYVLTSSDPAAAASLVATLD